MTSRIPHAELLGVGTLHNFKLRFHKFANIENQDGTQVQGVVWRISASDLRDLDKDEGLHDHYTRIPVEVHMDDGRVIRATAYIMEPSYDPDAEPTSDYIRDVGRGYRKHGIPLDQLKDALAGI